MSYGVRLCALILALLIATQSVAVAVMAAGAAPAPEPAAAMPCAGDDGARCCCDADCADMAGCLLAQYLSSPAWRFVPPDRFAEPAARVLLVPPSPPLAALLRPPIPLPV